MTADRSEPYPIGFTAIGVAVESGAYGKHVSGGAKGVQIAAFWLLCWPNLFPAGVGWDPPPPQWIACLIRSVISYKVVPHDAAFVSAVYLTGGKWPAEMTFL